MKALFIVVAIEKHFDKPVFAKKPISESEKKICHLYAFTSENGVKNYTTLDVYTEEEAAEIINMLDDKAKVGLESMWIKDWEMIQVA